MSLKYLEIQRRQTKVERLECVDASDDSDDSDFEDDDFLEVFIERND